MKEPPPGKQHPPIVVVELQIRQVDAVDLVDEVTIVSVFRARDSLARIRGAR